MFEHLQSESYKGPILIFHATNSPILSDPNHQKSTFFGPLKQMWPRWADILVPTQLLGTQTIFFVIPERFGAPWPALKPRKGLEKGGPVGFCRDLEAMTKSTQRQQPVSLVVQEESSIFRQAYLGPLHKKTSGLIGCDLFRLRLVAVLQVAADPIHSRL